MSGALSRAIQIIKSGGIVIYPTETLYALGCDCSKPEAVERIFWAKARKAAKPLPLIVGSWDQMLRFVQVDEAVASIVSVFWPGPLSVLMTMKGEFPPRIMDATRRTSIRWTPHPVASTLCRCVGVPLVATSANVSGKPGTALLEDLDPVLCSHVDGVVQEKPFPSGGDPSTLIEVLAPSRVRILRKGAIAPSQFTARGIHVVDHPC